MEGVRKFLITQETDFSADLKLNILEFLQEKLILLLHFITAIFTYPFEKIGEILLLLKSNILEFLQEKLTPLFHWIAVILTYLSEKIDEIFPPETREETLQRWLHIALTVFLPALVAGFVLPYGLGSGTCCLWTSVLLLSLFLSVLLSCISCGLSVLLSSSVYGWELLLRLPPAWSLCRKDDEGTGKSWSPHAESKF